MISQLTIELPVRLAQQLSALAAEQRKSVETVAVERLSASLELSRMPERGSPAAVMQAVNSLPNLTKEDVDALELAIEAGRLPVSNAGVFDEEVRQ